MFFSFPSVQVSEQERVLETGTAGAHIVADFNFRACLQFDAIGVHLIKCIHHLLAPPSLMPSVVLHPDSELS